ncbi:hypothetical protein JCM10908_001848 [Rhodotorula pacifica]|uniref:Trm82p n=1 Tax=Rhodotorula pacifica TaxID=1495444 RepID=UPI003174C1D9
MSVQHPVQALASTTELLITASDRRISTFDAATNAPISTATHHAALVRFLCTYSDPASSDVYLISTAEDKRLQVSRLPNLELLSSRPLLKRANALDVTSGGEIVVGDKFGDVYIFPLLPSTAEKPVDPKPAGEDDEQNAHQPILGHVSMLTSLALIPAEPASGLTHDWIATGDRDEHVRISRYPAGHVIEKFAWGSKSLVSSLLYLPPSTSATTATPVHSHAYLLAAGGDPTLQLFRLPSAELVRQFPIADLILPYIIVCAQRPVPIPAGRRKDKRGERKAKENSVDDAAQAGLEDEEATAEVTNAASASRQFSDLPKAMAVTKLLEIGTTRENGGIIVLVAGSTALLYVPFATLFADDASTDVPPPSLLPFSHPILDVVSTPIPSSAGSLCEVLVSLDTSRGPGSPDSVPLVRVSLRADDSSLAALPTLATDAVFFESACAESDSTPAVSSLYPVLSLLHHPGEVGDEADPELAAKDKRNRGKKRGWTTDPEALSESGGGIRPGKRAIGRAETLQRYEEAKRKLASGSEAALTEGEKAAVQAIEQEAQIEGTAVIEGSVVA